MILNKKERRKRNHTYLESGRKIERQISSKTYASQSKHVFEQLWSAAVLQENANKKLSNSRH